MSAAGGPDPLAALKPEVRALSAYTLPPRPHRVKVNQNENPFELPDAFKQELLARMGEADWGRYPEFVPAGLLEALGRFADWSSAGILAGNGSNELISVLFQATLGPGSTLALATPTFSLYASMARVLGAEVASVPLARGTLEFEVEALLETARARGARLLLVCSPNNPTGSHLGREALERLCLGFQEGLVVVDEAYHEFAGWSAVHLLKRHRHLVVLRTFSKAMALAALRVGYLLCDPALARELDKVRLPYNLNRFSTLVAEAALARYGELLAPSVGRIVALREQLRAEVAMLPGFRPYPSAANFFLVRCEAPPREVLAHLDARGILARDVSGQPGLADCFRLSVGDEEECAAVLAALREFAGARARAAGTGGAP